MKKKLLSLFLTIIITISIPLSVKASSPIKLWVNGSYIESDVDPIVENERSLVPIRVISESLGYEVHWDQSTQTVFIMSLSSDKTEITNALLLTLNENQLVKLDASKFNKSSSKSLNKDNVVTNLLENAVFFNLDAAPKSYNNRTMVPLRAISEAFGLNIRWDGVNSTVAIGDGYTAPAQSYNIVPLVSDVKKEAPSHEGDSTFHNPNDPAYLYANGRLIGNVESKIYHAPGQRSYQKVSVENAVYFNSDSEAVSAGYRKAKR